MSNEYSKSISGIVHYLSRIALPANSTLHVSLQDVTLMDAPARQLATQVTPNAETVGLRFNLEYSMTDVHDDRFYAISAQIRCKDRLIFTTTEHHSVVLGVDYLQPLEVLVHSVNDHQNE